MRLLVLLLLCISSVVLVEGGRRRRRWISRRRRRWNPVKAIKKVVRCPTSWWKVGGVNLLKYEKCYKFTIYWQNLANALARPWAGFGGFIMEVLNDAAKFFRDLGKAMKKFFELVGKKISDGLKQGSGHFVAFLHRSFAQVKGAMMSVGRFSRKVCDGLNVFKSSAFAEAQSERSSSSNWWARHSPNLCSSSRDSPNSALTLWDCGIGRALDRNKNGPGNISKVGQWLRDVGNVFAIIGRKLGLCSVPHKKACAFGKLMSMFPFVAVDQLNLCFFKVFDKKIVASSQALGKKIDRFFKSVGRAFEALIKNVGKMFGGFNAVSTSRSNAGDCHGQKTRTYRNYFGFEVFFDLMVAVIFGASMSMLCPFTWIFLLLRTVASIMSNFCVDIFIIFIRFGLVAGAVCGHKFTYGWCCPMWVFAGEWNMAKSPIRDPVEHNDKLKFKLVFRLCFLPRWGCGWNTQDSQHMVVSHGNSTTQFGICHGPGFKFLISDTLACEYPVWLKWPLEAVCIGVCIILGFNWSGSVATFFFGLFTLSWIGNNTGKEKPDFPINLMYDLWCGYIDICFSGDSACHRARHKRRGGRFR